MSQENVETARRACAAFLARDIDEWVGYHDPEVVFETLISEVEGPYRGHEGLRQWAAGLLAAFPDWTPVDRRYAALVAECSFTSPQVEKVQVVGPA
jgi:hypothetical protein